MQYHMSVTEGKDLTDEDYITTGVCKYCNWFDVSNISKIKKTVKIKNDVSKNDEIVAKTVKKS